MSLICSTYVFAQFDFVQRVQSLYESNLDFSDKDYEKKIYGDIILP